MDWISLLAAVGSSGILITIVTAWLNRKVTKGIANNSNADYADKIIAQADRRVEQALTDKERALQERDNAYTESKGQRKAKQEWREKFFAEQKSHHATQLELKDALAKLAEAEWHRCETNGCERRVPPRKREKTE